MHEFIKLNLLYMSFNFKKPFFFIQMSEVGEPSIPSNSIRTILLSPISI